MWEGMRCFAVHKVVLGGLQGRGECTRLENPRALFEQVRDWGVGFWRGAEFCLLGSGSWGLGALRFAGLSGFSRLSRFKSFGASSP